MISRGVFAGLESQLVELAAARPDWNLTLQGVNDSWHASINPTASGTSGSHCAHAATPSEAVRRVMVLALEAG